MEGLPELRTSYLIEWIDADGEIHTTPVGTMSMAEVSASHIAKDPTVVYVEINEKKLVKVVKDALK